MEDGADGGQAAAQAASPLAPFPRITRAAVEALRYRAEDVARALTKNVIRDVRVMSISWDSLLRCLDQHLRCTLAERPSAA